MFRKVLGASYEHSRYYVKFRLKFVHHVVHSTFPNEFPALDISGKLADSTFQVKEFVWFKNILALITKNNGISLNF